MSNQNDSLKENLADVSHQIWAHWMTYMFSQCEEGEDGSVVIPAEKYERWSRQTVAAYNELTHQEQESDREQADKILNVFYDYLGWTREQGWTD